MTILCWSASLAALVGVWLNIHRHVACFCLLSATNAVWVYADLKHGIRAQAALQAVYFVLALYGIRKWTAEKVEKAPAPLKEKGG